MRALELLLRASRRLYAAVAAFCWRNVVGMHLRQWRWRWRRRGQGKVATIVLLLLLLLLLLEAVVMLLLLFLRGRYCSGAGHFVCLGDADAPLAQLVEDLAVVFRLPAAFPWAAKKTTK